MLQEVRDSSSGTPPLYGVTSHSLWLTATVKNFPLFSESLAQLLQFLCHVSLCLEALEQSLLSVGKTRELSTQTLTALSDDHSASLRGLALLLGEGGVG